MAEGGEFRMDGRMVEDGRRMCKRRGEAGMEEEERGRKKGKESGRKRERGRRRVTGR